METGFAVRLIVFGTVTATAASPHCASRLRACIIVGWSHRSASRLIRLPLFHEQATQPDHVSALRFCMLLVGETFTKAENGDFAVDTARYRRLALAVLRLLTRSTEAMVNAAYEAVWFDFYRAINNRRDFTRAVRAMITTAISGS